MLINLDEARYLTSRTIDPCPETDPFKRATLLKKEHGEFSRAVAELLDARAGGKLPTHWYADSDSAQQATPLPVAQVRFDRIREVLGSPRVHDVTCSIGTEGSAAAGLEYFGSDLSLPRLIMAKANVTGHFFQADALRPAMTADVVIADPARRAGGRRITAPQDLIPPLPDLLATISGEAAIKCAPGIDYTSWEGLVSVVSVDGGVKEACLYTPGLAGGITREAVVIRGRGVDKLSDALPSADELAAPHGTYLIDPDGAIVRAGLVRQFAVREGLWMLDERIAYLTGDRIPDGYTGFPILEQVPLKKLKGALASFQPGSLEILVRGVDIDPDALRKKLRPRGERPMAVVVTRIGSQGVAFICGARGVGS
ncbi:SAM-dependent methyltransferase [Corynebacterium hindlerae]|uniref:SAM-dependent methyltransferase n=1 Tax=Corynebacterium hindlerae TaxID=699041 RepID=A0A7G5FIV8_9CORY|nr:SAM-dependent methyltransferase [Corynebacterium hindlerae]